MDSATSFNILLAASAYNLLPVATGVASSEQLQLAAAAQRQVEMALFARCLISAPDIRSAKLPVINSTESRMDRILTNLIVQRWLDYSS